MFLNNVHTRIRFTFLIVILILLIIIARVFYIQVFSYNNLSTLAENLWSRNLPVDSNRGEIIDINGVVLATNITTTSLVVVPNQILDKEYAAKMVCEIVNGDCDDILKDMNNNVSIQKISEAQNLTYDIADQINDLFIDGLYLLKESQRYYPYGDVLSHVLGYVGSDNQGLSGLEYYYDEYLTGKDGSIKYFSDGQGNKLQMAEVYESPTDGITIQLSIDINLQLAIENELDNVDTKYNPIGSIIIAMDPNNGQILAMASRPNFDSNDYQKYSTEIINRNLPIWMTYEPGSTFKIITLAAALEENVVDLFEDTFIDTGAIDVDGVKLHCWKDGGHGLQTYLEVVQNSCNPGFVSLGQKLGTENLMNYITKFGFGTKTGIDINGESSGILFDINNMGPIETATTAFGQGVSVTAIQQITAVSAAINGGYLYTPYLVTTFIDSETNSVINSIDKELKYQVVSNETSDLTKFALETVVAYGTGVNAYIENYRIGGKTGTAQKVVDGSYSDTEYILSFTGFMPADDPQIVLYVAVDSPKNVVQYGGTVAAPIAKNIFTSSIDIFNFSPSNEVLPKEYTWLEEQYIQVPCTEGLSLDEAKTLLKGFDVQFSGNGNEVFYQNPSCNSYIKETGTVLIQTN
ncbi:MAG: penicillin-binding transpeptidase domain-containing protein [bacterium]